MRRFAASIAILAGLFIPLYGQEGDSGKGGQDPNSDPGKRKSSFAVWLQEAFEDAAKTAGKRKGWRAQIHISSTSQTLRSLTVPFSTQGTVVVKCVDPKTRWLFWDEWFDRAGANARKPDLELVSQTLYKGAEFLHTDTKAKTLEKYDFSKKTDFLFAQMIVREGLAKDWEKIFEIQLFTSAKHMFLSPTKRSDGDLRQMGFKNKEEYDRAMKKLYETIHNPNEDRLYKNRKPDPVVPEEDKIEQYYMIRMTPLTKDLAQDLHVSSIIMKLTPEFLPMLIVFDGGTDGTVSIRFSHRKADPSPDIKDSEFQLDAADFTVKEPQKGE